MYKNKYKNKKKKIIRNSYNIAYAKTIENRKFNCFENIITFYFK